MRVVKMRNGLNLDESLAFSMIHATFNVTGDLEKLSKGKPQRCAKYAQGAIVQRGKLRNGDLSSFDQYFLF
jgi:hypothetical protein